MSDAPVFSPLALSIFADIGVRHEIDSAEVFEVSGFLFYGGVYSIGPSISEGADGPQTGKPRSLLAADYEKKIVAQINSDNSIAWQKEIRDIHDAQPLPDGHWLLQTAFSNVVEIDRQGKEVWRYDAGKNDKGNKSRSMHFEGFQTGGR